MYEHALARYIWIVVIVSNRIIQVSVLYMCVYTVRLTIIESAIWLYLGNLYIYVL